MEPYISVPLATMGIGLLLAVVALFLLVKTAEKVRASAWWLAFVSVGLNGAGIYLLINPYVLGSYSYMLGLPALGTLAIVWFIGFFVAAAVVYALYRPYLVHGLDSPTPPHLWCVTLFWPLAALGAYALYIAYGSYSPKSREKPAEVAPISWEEARKKQPTATVEATKDADAETEEPAPAPGKYPKKRRKGERW